MESNTKKDKTSNLLYKIIDNITKKAQKEILDNVQCAVEGTDRWNAVRSRILGSTNNAKRELWTEIQRNWKIEHDPDVICEDIIVVKGPAQVKEKRHAKGTKEN